MTPDPAVEQAVDRVAALLRTQIGLRPQSSLRGRLRRSIQDEAAAGHQAVQEFVDELAVHRGALQRLVNQVTVQESSFFRHPEHFKVLVRDILPTLSGPVRIWCAGCGNGQEAFSLAMALQEQNLDGTVYATDLSNDAVARTQNAYYTTRELAGLSPQRIVRHLSKTGPGWTINADLRSRVTAWEHNLIDPLPDQVQSCQVVFCRNVLIYFDPDQARTLLSRIADAIPAAVVFLGATETMWTVTDRFQTLQAGDCYFYRRRAEVASAVAAHAGTGGGGGRQVRPGQHAHGLTESSPPAPKAHRSRAKQDVEPVVQPLPGAAALARAGQLALSAGDHGTAVVAFRKCAYLTPDDAVAHLHLGLALEASGDNSAARRAFATARRTMLESPSTHSDDIGGYATDELLRLLETKQKELAP